MRRIPPSYIKKISFLYKKIQGGIKRQDYKKGNYSYGENFIIILSIGMPEKSVLTSRGNSLAEMNEVPERSLIRAGKMVRFQIEAKTPKK